MTYQEINIAIAEACGKFHHRWKQPTGEIAIGGDPIDLQCEDCCQFQSEDPTNHCVLAEVPNYCGDLNAWKDVLESVAQDGWMIIITKGRDGWGCLLESGTIKNSDMRQFSGDGQTPEGAIGEAFLRMKGLWK